MRLLKAMVLAVLLLGLSVGLSACGVWGKTPPQVIVERAIATQLAQTQQALIEQLAPSIPQTPNFKLTQVKVVERDLVEPGDSPVYRVRGAYRAAIALPSRQVKEDSIFEIYLQSEVQPAPETGKAITTWYLVKSTAPGWSRTALPG